MNSYLDTKGLNKWRRVCKKHSFFVRILMCLRLILIFQLIGILSCEDDDFFNNPPIEEVLYSDIAPAWSPDGKKIAYYHTDYENDTTYPTGLYVLDTNGANKRLLVLGYADSPDWSSDGKWIAYRNGAIYAVNLAGDSIRKITTFTAHFPSWSPDGKKITFDTPYLDPKGSNVIWISNSDGSEIRDISQHGVGEWRMPDWSPIGRRIVHSRYLLGTQNEEIFIMDTNGNNAIRLTENNLTERNPKWSPDGNAIIWWLISLRGTEIWQMKSDGTQKHFITDGKYPSWSPSGDAITFSNLNIKKTKYVIWTIKKDSSILKQLTK